MCIAEPTGSAGLNEVKSSFIFWSLFVVKKEVIIVEKFRINRQKVRSVK